MKLNSYRDANGTSLQSYVDVLVEKIAEQPSLTGFVIICDLERARKDNEGLHLVSCLGEGGLITQVPDILRLLAKQMQQNSFVVEGHSKLHGEA
jgi:hypothetical protein